PRLVSGRVGTLEIIPNYPEGLPLLVGLSPICKPLSLLYLVHFLLQITGSYTDMKISPERQALVFQSSTHPCNGRHVLVPLNRGDARGLQPAVIQGVALSVTVQLVPLPANKAR